MVQGLGGAHNTDVLLEPPIQIPIYTHSQLIVECKNYLKKIGLGIVRGALGLREDVNHFALIDSNTLKARKNNYSNLNVGNRVVKNSIRYRKTMFQVAVASMNGFTKPAYEFAYTHGIPLISFERSPFSDDLNRLFGEMSSVDVDDAAIDELIDRISNRIALGINALGQFFIMFSEKRIKQIKDLNYTLHWESVSDPWVLRTNEYELEFWLPDELMREWLYESATKIKQRALDIKQGLSNIVLYYKQGEVPCVKALSIQKGFVEEARRRLDL